MSHLFIAAAHKSSGKTTISVGLAGALNRRGMAVQTFKKGPDYIDPMWLARASDRSCFNLDFNTMSHNEITDLFAARSTGADLGLIESNKGLFDGVDLEGCDSNAALAKLVNSPVVLVIDSTGTTRGIAPLLHGYQVFDPDIKIAGVILNKVGGPRHEGKLRAAVERYTDIPVLGAIGRNENITIDERHLGLTTPNEIEQLEVRLSGLYDAISNGVNVDQLLETASEGVLPVVSIPVEKASKPDVKIAIARDKAFSYYYPDDLEALEQAGAELLFFDALNDSQLPKADGLFIGGGFPETHMKALEANRELRFDIRSKLQIGMPAYAECGGLMYLCESLTWQGAKCEMVGAIEGDAIMCNRPQGRGYSQLQNTSDHPWALASNADTTASTPAHEFHFARIENLPDQTRYAFSVLRGQGLNGKFDGIVINNLLAGFCHMRNTATNPWADRFVEHVRTIKNENH